MSKHYKVVPKPDIDLTFANSYLSEDLFTPTMDMTPYDIIEVWDVEPPETFWGPWCETERVELAPREYLVGSWYNGFFRTVRQFLITEERKCYTKWVEEENGPMARSWTETRKYVE